MFAFVVWKAPKNGLRLDGMEALLLLYGLSIIAASGLSHLLYSRAAIILTLLCLASCRQEEPLVIQIYYDSSGAFVETGLERKTWDFNFGNRRLNGRPLMLAKLSTSDYQKTLREIVPRVRPALVVFNSPADVQQLGSSVKPEDAVNLCAPRDTCLAIIPQWVEGDRLAATKELLLYLQAK